jgi:hypothetical protein
VQNQQQRTVNLNMQFITSQHYEELAIKFWQAYKPIKLIYLPDSNNKKQLKPRNKRRCRYCGLDAKKTTFKKDAHFFPESLGNKTLFSDYECDKCNAIFGTYEDQLAKFFEIERPLNKIKGKEKYPSYKAPDKELKISVGKVKEKNVVEIERLDSENQLITFNEESLTWKISMKRNPIIPNKIYKYLLKLGLSLLPENDVNEDYQTATKYILNRLENSLKQCVTVGYVLPIFVCYKPHAYLFVKRNPEENISTHVVSFYCFNYIISVPLLFNKKDFKYYSEKIRALTYPPFFHELDDAVNSEIRTFALDFSSEKKEQLNNNELFVQIEKDEWENRAGFDLNSKQHVDGNAINPNEIVRIVLTDNNFDLLSSFNLD